MALPRQGGVSSPKSMTEVPLFYLGHIGGVKGLRNWIRLDHEHGRATGPIANTYRYGRTGIEVHLIELAVGMEYWTNLHKKLGRAWAQPRRLRKKTNEPLPMSIGRHVGPAFSDFVGDLDKWSQLFLGRLHQLEARSVIRIRSKGYRGSWRLRPTATTGRVVESSRWQQNANEGDR
jgi:hypothetical protein